MACTCDVVSGVGPGATGGACASDGNEDVAPEEERQSPIEAGKPKGFGGSEIVDDKILRWQRSAIGHREIDSHALAIHALIAGLKLTLEEGQ